MHVSSLFIYPVKSLRGCAVSSAKVDALGLVGDRRFLVVDPGGHFMTQRVFPRMAQISTALSPVTLTLRATTAGEIAIPLNGSPGPAETRRVSIWKSEGLEADDCGDPAADWLAAILRTPCRLVRIGERFRRPVLKPAAQPGDLVAFADAVPFLAISRSSLCDLNGRLAAHGEPSVPMDRFRPNLVVSGCAPYAEDTWAHVRVGEITLRAAGPCARCVMTTTDQLTGERGRQPLEMLATYRRDARDANAINFGQNFIHETKSGTLHVGDNVQVI